MVDLRVDEEVHERQPLPRGDGWEVGDVHLTQRPDGRWSVQHGTTTHIAHGIRIGDVLWMRIDGRVHRLEVVEAGAGATEEEGLHGAHAAACLRCWSPQAMRSRPGRPLLCWRP